MQIDTHFRRLPFSARFFGGIAAVVVACAALVGGLTVVGYEHSQKLLQKVDRDFAALQSLSEVSAKLAAIHISVQKLLEEAGQKFDEEQVYTRGTAAIEALDTLALDIQVTIGGNAALAMHAQRPEAHRDPASLIDLVHAYRGVVVSAIEMTSVDVSLARKELISAADEFNQTTAAFIGLIREHQEHLDDDFVKSFDALTAALLWWGAPVTAIVVLVLAISWLMTKRLSEDLGRVLVSMRTLGGGDTDISIPDLRGDRDLAPIGDALGVFRSALIDLKQSQAVLEQKVHERTRELQDAVAELEREVTMRARTERKLTIVLESMDQGMYAVDPDLTITMMNSRFADLYGLPPALRRPGTKYEDMTRFNAEQGIFGPGDVDEHVKKRMALARDPHAFEAELNLRSGRVVDWRSRPLPGGGFVRTATDITERREMETQLRQAHKMQSLGNLAGGLAHEINNLLLPILALAQMTQKQFPAGSRDAVRMQKIVEASERAKALVAQVMAFGRQDEPNMESTDICKVVHETMELIYRTLLSTIALNKKLDERTGQIWADAAQIGAVVINLVNNAQDAVDGKSGTIDVSLGPVEVNEALAKRVAGLGTGRYAKLTVADSGKGMDDETLRRVFDPFFTTKEVGTGTGLGMSMVYGIVKRHEGAIDMMSKPGVGTTVAVYLPLIGHGSAAGDSQPGGVAAPIDAGTTRTLRA